MISIPTMSLLSPEVSKMLRAFSGSGGLLLRDALVPSLVREAHSRMAEAFAVPESLLAHPYDKKKRTGYTPPGVEGTKREGRNFKRHFFDYMPGMRIENVEVLQSFHRRLVDVGVYLLHLIDTERGTSLVDGVMGNGHLLRSAEYLNAEVDPSAVLFPEHIDFGLLTLFVGGASKGLQVKVGEAWVDVFPECGEILVGVGSLLRQYRPEFVSMRHRVVADAAERLSFFLFLEPRPEVLLPNGERADEFLNRILATVRND